MHETVSENFEQEKLPRDWNQAEKMAWIGKNEKIILKAIGSYQRRYEYDDLLQMAYEACLKCFLTCDPARNTMLSTCCFQAIRNSVNMALRYEAAKKRCATAVSLYSRETGDDDPRRGYEDCDNSDTDMLHAQQLSVPEQVESRDRGSLPVEVVRKYLTREEQRVVKMAADGYTQMKIARTLGCSQAKVSSLFRFIRSKITHGYREKGYEFPWMPQE